MRCSRREEPCGSHHSAARALKWETSSGLTEEKVGFELLLLLLLLEDEDDDEEENRCCLCARHGDDDGDGNWFVIDKVLSRSSDGKPARDLDTDTDVEAEASRPRQAIPVGRIGAAIGLSAMYLRRDAESQTEEARQTPLFSIASATLRPPRAEKGGRSL
jgi:hypothetical protein